MNVITCRLTAILALLLSGCGGEPDADAPDNGAQDGETAISQASEPPPPPPPSDDDLLDRAVEGAWRGDETARDVYRNPRETLKFFGLKPDMTVVEVWPGGGWYTNVIAPYVASGGGVYYAAHFDDPRDDSPVSEAVSQFRETYAGAPDLYGDVRVTSFSSSSNGVAPDGTADMVLTFRNLHNWIDQGYAAKAMADFYRALKPGGVLGVVGHRASETEGVDDDPRGYVRESAAIALAETAGFEFVARSEINANPKDTKDHPAGVWSLPPVLRLSAYSDETAREDTARFLEIGESDRFTLKFRKPVISARSVEDDPEADSANNQYTDETVDEAAL